MAKENQSVLVSVVMASYNHKEYISRAIQSVIDQTYDNWELIIIDDGSIDGTVEKIESFLGDKRIKFFAQENHGVSYTTNRCIEKVQGDVICFLDSDDVYMPEKLEKQVALYRDGYDLISTKIDVINQDGEIMPRSRRTKKYNEFDVEVLSKKNLSDLLRRSYFIKSSVMIKKQLIDDAGGFDERLIGAYDWHLWLKILLQARVRRCDYHGVQYRLHGKNEVVVNNNRVNTEVILICKWYKHFFSIDSKSEAYEQYMCAMKYYFEREYFALIYSLCDLFEKKSRDGDVFALLQDDDFLDCVENLVSKKRERENRDIKKMRTSKFWKARNIYMKLKGK